VTHQLVRRFPIASPPKSLLAVAQKPLLAPAYLNFLESIEATDTGNLSDGWAAYKVRISYRSIFRAYEVIEHHVDYDTQTARLRHNSPLACFDATYVVGDQHVDLSCSYEAKLPVVAWLISIGLDRMLAQIVAAMDRYAASLAPSPT
jgi:hypothetical protein